MVSLISIGSLVAIGLITLFTVSTLDKTDSIAVRESRMCQNLTTQYLCELQVLHFKDHSEVMQLAVFPPKSTGIYEATATFSKAGNWTITSAEWHEVVGISQFNETILNPPIQTPDTEITVFWNETRFSSIENVVFWNETEFNTTIERNRTELAMVPYVVTLNRTETVPSNTTIDVPPTTIPHLNITYLKAKADKIDKAKSYVVWMNTSTRYKSEPTTAVLTAQRVG